jgi:membrane protease YdiL (CAAX protease family)
MKERLTRRDWTLIAVCAAIAAVSLFVIFRWFNAAFPEASIEFRYDRKASMPLAESVLARQGLDPRGMKHTAIFDGDGTAKIFLERSVGLTRANIIMRRDVRLWWWRNRWFRPLQEEEYDVAIAPTGELVGFTQKIPEDRALPAIDGPAARRTAELFLTGNGIRLTDLQLVAQSERNLPRRTQRIFTWDSQSVHPAGAPYRHEVRVDGDRVTNYEQRIRVPDEWERSYRELRSKNLLAGNVDVVFFLLTMVGAVSVFIIRLLRGDIRPRLLIAIAVASVVLVTGVALNSWPLTLANYVTTSSYPAFVAQTIVFALLQGIGFGMLLVVVVGSGEVLYRERMPQHLAIPRLWQRRALTSKRVFLSFVIGYALVAFFLAYQVVFYLIAEKFGAWAPAEIPYDEMINTAFPWIAVLFAGFFPSLSEEFLSRAFSIPFFERLFRSRIAAIILAGFIWGFGHATYPNQPFFIRGLEVGLAGVLLGFLFFRFGLLPLLIWHYTVDALYTALLLMRSGNTYYVVSSALASLVFAVPMLMAIVLYVRHRGFEPDEDLSNATLPTTPPPVRVEEVRAGVELPPAIGVTRARVVVCLIVVAAACTAVAIRPPSIDDAVDYRTTAAQANQAASQWGAAALGGVHYAKTLAHPLEGFRSWDSGSPREEGGAPSSFDSTAADYLIEKRFPIRALIEVMKTKIEAATWMVRSFTPGQKDESFVEIDPRLARVIGYHRMQEQKKPGSRLGQAAAMAIAQAAFPRFGVDLNAFELKEALAFQQPNRLDWLFHFQERQPVAADGYRRISVRVQGNEVTQFTTTIKIPDPFYREANAQTLLNVVFQLLKLVGFIAALSLVVAGFVIAARKNRFPWRRPLLWTAVLAIVPIAAALLRWKSNLFAYDTSIGWDTFISSLIIRLITQMGFQIGLTFLALAGIEAVYPHALDLTRREARARVGRAALVGALTAIGCVLIRRVLLQVVMLQFPSVAWTNGIAVPLSVGTPMPFILGIGDALIRAIEASAAIALFVAALRGANRRWLPAAAAALIVFCMSLDAGVTAHQTPLMLLSSATAGLLAWLIGEYVLRDNLLAYPLTIALVLILNSGGALLQNHRADLQTAAFIEIAAAVALAIWVAAPRVIPENA